MIIKRKLFTIEIEDGPEYKVAAESFDEAVALVRKWRPGCEICRVIKYSDSTVLTKEDVKHETGKA